MMRVIRYALATMSFAASVGCLALWWRSIERHDSLAFAVGKRAVFCDTLQSQVAVSYLTYASAHPAQWRHLSADIDDEGRVNMPYRRFAKIGQVITVPLWYPALIFALAGVGVLRFRRQFSIRSALVVVSVVAALLGMVVAL